MSSVNDTNTVLGDGLALVVVVSLFLCFQFSYKQTEFCVYEILIKLLIYALNVDIISVHFVSFCYIFYDVRAHIEATATQDSR